MKESEKSLKRESSYVFIKTGSLMHFGQVTNLFEHQVDDSVFQWASLTLFKDTNLLKWTVLQYIYRH